ncbi:hypothetical protein [Paenarthrobacter sp. NPDC090522]|uniref:hypothetical protein n=1 Tax=Paenarthrobacter sp. NPDC090522 TaxID=3364383 RepID=UPI00380003C5
MMTRIFPWALRLLGCTVAVSSAISANLLWLAPPPEGLKILDPQTLKTIAVVSLGILGVLIPLAVVVTKAVRYPLLKAAVFALAAFTNAMTLGPDILVEFQDISSTAAEVSALLLTVASLVVYMDRVQNQVAARKSTT